MTTPQIVRRWDGAAVLTFPFDRWLVDALKAEIPGHARTYSPDDRSWTISAAYGHVASRLMHDVFPDVDVIGAPTPPPFDRGTGTREDPYVILHLRPTAPPELVDAAYKCLARLTHPDRGGDHDTMVRLNEAREMLR